MIKPYPCPRCQGAGCSNCNNIGFFGRDETNDYYLSRSANGEVTVSGIKESSGKNVFEQILSIIFGIITKQMEEPRDFIWAVKQRKK